MRNIIWTEDDTQFLIQWWPHFGTKYVAEQLKLTNQQVKSKVDKLGILKLPKKERLCIACKINNQYVRRCGNYCHKCFNKRRQYLRYETEKPLKERFNEILRSIRYRKEYDIDLAYLYELWDRQAGLCYYTGLPLIIPRWGTSRNMATREPFSLSLDRVDSSKGYLKGNVVFCGWAVNVGKNNFPLDLYINICRKVVEYDENNIK